MNKKIFFKVALICLIIFWWKVWNVDINWMITNLSDKNSSSNSTYTSSPHTEQISLFWIQTVSNTINQFSEYDIQKQKHTDEAKAVLQQYYIYQSRGDYNKAAQLYDKESKSDDAIIEFFNEDRLRRFNTWIDGSRKIVNTIQENVNLRDDNEKRVRRAFTYQLQYSLEGKIYIEDRETVMIYRKDENTRQINEIYCRTNYCVNNPFFAFDKFWL